MVLAWDVRNAPTLSWRVLRSDHDFAETADALVGGGQTLVSESAQCGARDTQIDDDTTYYYTVFARDGQGAWHCQVKTKIKPAERLRWRHPAHWETIENDCTDCGDVQREPDLVALRIQSQQVFLPPNYR